MLIDRAIAGRVPSTLVKALERTQQFSFDLECDPPPGGRPSDAKNARLAVPSLLTVASGSYAGAFDFRNPLTGDLISYLCRHPELECVVHNALYDLVVLHTKGVVDAHEIRARVRDSMILQFLLDEKEDKSLKDMVRIHLKHRMATYEETTVKNPRWIRISEIEKRLAALRKVEHGFGTARPWPEFSSERLLRKSDVRKRYRAHMDSRWPGTRKLRDGQPIPKKDGGFQMKHTREEQAARRAFRDEQEALIEERFGFAAGIEFGNWVTEQVEIPGLAEIDDLRDALHRDLVEYAKDDARQTLRLWNKLLPKVERAGWRNWLDVECYDRWLTVRASVTGIPTDLGKLRELNDVMTPLVDEFGEDIQAHTRGWTDKKGRSFNPDSPEQVRAVVFDFLNEEVPVFRKEADGRTLPKLTPGGEKFVKEHELKLDLSEDKVPLKVRQEFLSADKEILERIRHPIGMAILNHRAVGKLKGTYVDSALARASAHPEHRLLGYFNSIGTGTGRLSSADPNLQNIPSRKKPDIYDERIQGLGPKIREAFVAEPGKVMIVADQSQVELRIITHYTRDSNLVAVYSQGIEIDGTFYSTGDIHAKTSNELGIPRKLAKNVNFGFNYGMGPLKFARQISLFIEGTFDYDIEKAKEWRDGFFRTYPNVLGFIEHLTRQWKQEKKRNFKMLSGRLRHFPDEPTTGGKILNSKVQGSSADILKVNMMIIDQFVRPVCPSLELLFQVHDELGYQCDPEEAELAGMLIKYVMEVNWIPMSVPILASAKVCHSWAAKDDDDLPEIGSFYAHADGRDRVFTPEEWGEYRELEDAGKVEVKSATAMLTPEQVEVCEKYVPSPGEVPELEGIAA